MIVNEKFIAIPKEYNYPEDLEEGIFPDNQDLIVKIVLGRNVVEVYSTRFERKCEKQCDVEVTKYLTIQCKYVFNLDDYIIFIDGVKL